MADQLLHDDRDVAVLLRGLRGDFPSDLGRVLGDPAVNLPVEILDDLRAALVPPGLGRRDLLPVLRDQGVRQVRVGVGLRLVVVGGVGSFPVAAVRALTELLDLEQPHHLLVIFLRGDLGIVRRLPGGCFGRRVLGVAGSGCEGEEQGEGEDRPWHGRAPRERSVRCLRVLTGAEGRRKPVGDGPWIGTIGTVGLGAGVVGLNDHCGERPVASGQIRDDQTAGIGFWNGERGQDLINAINGGVGTRPGDWPTAAKAHPITYKTVRRPPGEGRRVFCWFSGARSGVLAV